MHDQEKRVLMGHFLKQGLSKAAIARELKVSRQTLYRWLKEGEGEPGQSERRRKQSKLDDYKGIIKSRLAAYPKLSAKRLYKEVRKAGYEGGYGQVKRHVRGVRPRQEGGPVERFETEPGQQGQVDFAQFQLPWGRRYALLVVLGYSRLLWIRFYERQTMEVVMRGLEESFEYFGGVPQELLFDQMKAVIVEDRRVSGGKLLKNEEFLRFSRHWGFQVRACRPYRAQTKGKVERPIRYLREDFFYGREFVSDEDLNARVQSWRDGEANARQHGTLQEQPWERFKREQDRLRPLASRPYQSAWTSLPRAESETGQVSQPWGEVVVEKRPLSEYGRLGEGQG